MEENKQYVAIITEEQANELRDQFYTYRSIFNPILINGNWIITIEEIINCTTENFQWVKGLEIIDLQQIQPPTLPI